MPSFRVENEEKPSVGVVTVGASPPAGLEAYPVRDWLSNEQIRSVMADGQAYHTPNKLILKLIPFETESERPIFHSTMSRQDSWRFQLYFRDRAVSDTPLERDAFGVIAGGVIENITITGGGSTAEISFADDAEVRINDAFARLGITRPEFGFMYFTFRATFSGRPESENRFHFIIKISFDPVTTVRSTPVVSTDVSYLQVDYTSKPLAFESLHVPSITGSFKYNFFEVDEDSLLAARRKNYNRRSLGSIPRYIELSWTPAPAVRFPIRPVETGVVAETEVVVPEAGGRPTIRLGETFDRFREIGLASEAAREMERIGRSAPAVDIGVDDFSGGGRMPPEPSVEAGFAIRIGGEMYSIGGGFEEEASIFDSRTSTSRMARRGLPRRFSPSRRPGFVGDDSTVSLGLPEEEDLIIRELVRNTDQPDAIAGPNEFSRYIGYVLLKERFNPDSAQFEPIDMITVLDRRKTRIVDTKIAYGDTYRYKVRSVFKFVNVDELPLFRDQDTVISGALSGVIRSVFDGGIPFRHAFYFDSKYSDPVEILTTEGVRPDAPYNITLLPNSVKHEIFITWNQKQQERDVTGFNIYRRVDSPGSSWTKLNETPLALRHNFFVDNVLDSDIWYIYAVESVDHHDNFSKLSVQPKASLRTQDFSLGRLEYPVRMHLNKETEFGEDDELTVSDVTKFKKQMKIVINPLFGNLDREANYLLLIKSLDTFIEKEVKLNFLTKVITHSGAVTISDDTFETRREQIEESFREAERLRFGLTSQEARRRRNRRLGREDFEE